MKIKRCLVTVSVLLLCLAAASEGLSPSARGLLALFAVLSGVGMKKRGA